MEFPRPEVIALGAAVIIAGGFLNGVGHDLWTLVRDRYIKRRE